MVLELDGKFEHVAQQNMSFRRNIRFVTTLYLMKCPK